MSLTVKVTKASWFFFCLGLRKKRKIGEDDEYSSKKPKMDEVS